MIRTNNRKKNIMKKCLILLAAIVVLVGVIAFGQWQTNREHQEYEESLIGTEAVTTVGDVESVPESGTTEESPAAVTEDVVYTAGISNLDYYCTPVMGEDAVLLVESLNYYLAQKGIVCDSGEIIYVQVPQEEPESVRYYVKLNDESSRIVILEYHTVENLVTCSLCNYSYEEIVGEVWNGGAPADRDVSPEEDTAYLESQTAEEAPVEGQEVIQ